MSRVTIGITVDHRAVTPQTCADSIKPLVAAELRALADTYAPTPKPKVEPIELAPLKKAGAR